MIKDEELLNNTDESIAPLLAACDRTDAAIREFEAKIAALKETHHLECTMPLDKHTLLSVADGPESIEIYTSEDEAVVDWAAHAPALYITATINGAMVKLGPFQLQSILEGVKKALVTGSNL
jgi:hypothetical protein